MKLRIYQRKLAYPPVIFTVFSLYVVITHDCFHSSYVLFEARIKDPKKLAE